MRVMLLTSDGRQHWLAGQPGVSERIHSSVGNFRKSCSVAEQVNEFVRAAASEVVDRGNILTTLSFSTTRQFPTVEAAELWVLDYEVTWPREGMLVLESILPGGAVRRRYMAGAVVRPPDLSYLGTSVAIQYVVRGGLIKSNIN